MPSDLQIQVEQIGIATILKNYTLKMPPHQREYSWTDKEVSALFDDIAEAIFEDATAYFLGTIVTIPVAGTSALTVVDGQQRLATTAILLAAMRDYLATIDGEEIPVKDLEDHLTYPDRVAKEQVSRLSLNNCDRQFFDERVIQGKSSTPKRPISHVRIADAAIAAREQLHTTILAANPKHPSEAIDKWVTYLEQKAQVILLKVSDEGNAFRMFETLNDRGLRTTQADLIKNRVFGQSGDRSSEAQVRWASMRAVLEAMDDGDITLEFLRQMLISLYGHVKRGDVYELASKHSKGPTKALRLLTTLENGAADYAATTNPLHEKWNAYPPTIRRAVRTLNLVRMGAMRPVLLSIARTFGEKDADKAFRVVIRASVRLMIAGGASSAARSGSVEVAVAEAARKISDKEIRSAPQLLAQLSPIIPNDTQFREAFAVHGTTNQHFGRYFLRALLAQQRDQANPLYLDDDGGTWTLEHVLPINTLGKWPEFSDEEVDVFHRRLGNHALLDSKANSGLGSAAFAEKKKVFAKSTNEMTRQIAELAVWGKKEIQDRQKAMADLAVKAWPVAAT